MTIAQNNSFILENDTKKISEHIDKILSGNPDAIMQYKNGDCKVFGFLMGEAMRSCGNSANPKLIKEILMNKLVDIPTKN